ncbi:MAG: Gfo/Idh/MocA family oxidoreductase [Pseudomonadota bacterium]
MSVRTIVVGCGAVAQRLYRKPLVQLSKQKMIEIVGLVDPAREHADELSAAFAGARHFTTLDEACKAARPELTLVLTPPHLHCAQTQMAFAHGSHVLCEKPMANSSAECLRMIEAARVANRVLAIGMIRRFFPAFARLRDLVQAGALGSLESFEYREGHKFEWAVTTPAAFRPRAKGGAGVLFDIGTHALDFLLSVFGDLSVLDYADDAAGGIETTVAMRLHSPKCNGSMSLAWDVPQVNELRVVGTQAEAVLRIDRFDQLAIGRRGAFVPQAIDVSFPVDLERKPQKRIVPLSYSDAVLCQIVQVLRAIKYEERPAVDGVGGAACINLLENALSKSTALPEPWLTPREQAAAAQLHGSTR